MEYNDFLDRIAAVSFDERPHDDAAAIVRKLHRRKKNKVMVLTSVLLVAIGGTALRASLLDEHSDYALWQQARPNNPAQQQWKAYLHSQRQKEIIKGFEDL